MPFTDIYVSFDLNELIYIWTKLSMYTEQHFKFRDEPKDGSQFKLEPKSYVSSYATALASQCNLVLTSLLWTSKRGNFAALNLDMGSIPDMLLTRLIEIYLSHVPKRGMWLIGFGYKPSLIWQNRNQTTSSTEGPGLASSSCIMLCRNSICNMFFFIRPFVKRTYYAVAMSLHPSVRPLQFGLFDLVYSQK